MVVVSHPPDSPDLAICDFFLFPQIQPQLSQCHSQHVLEIQEQLLIVLSFQVLRNTYILKIISMKIHTL
jgi:hypothetical protein